MIRSENQIRLTRSEKETLDTLCGGAELKGPKTEQELSKILDNAQAAYQQGDSAEEALLAALTSDVRVEFLGSDTAEQSNP